jgi:glyoxylase-like metal-dependent hydrolase (beta-lactamase superfamily II)
MIRELAPDLFQLCGFPANVINQYLIGDVLVDSGTRTASRRLFRSLRGRAIKAHALTHAHPDHQGSSRKVCRALGIPLWCSEADREAAEDPEEMMRRMPLRGVAQGAPRIMMGPGHPVERTLSEGEEISGGFVVIFTPGHTAGHVSSWRERDRVLVAGDVFANWHVLTPFPGLSFPPRFFSCDPEQNRKSARRLASLDPRLIVFGHGRPLSDMSRFHRFIDDLGGKPRSA